MTVYVDKSRNKFGRMVMCHMVADSLEELHEMAQNIGMRREWFQGEGTMPHYDVSLSRKKLALQFGAVEIKREKLVELVRKYRNEKTQ